MKRWMTMAAASTVLSAGLIATHAADERQEQPTTDQLLIDAQKNCPVSGESLEAMGGPIKAQSGDRTVFLCCRGCLGKSISKENWEQVTANLIAAQGTCPVMGRELPENPASVVVNKRTVFVCCKPCIKKIEADPEKYLAAVDELLRKNVQSEESEQR